MIISTNPGSNLSPALIERYDIAVTPQQIVVDGEYHDTRSSLSHEQVNAWVLDAERHPYVLGTSAAEYAGIFRELSRRDAEIVSVQTSRKIIGSHDAALSATKVLADTESTAHVHVEIVDTQVTDVGAGLATVLACEARDAGLSLKEVADVVRAFSSDGHLFLIPQTLDNLVKGGRASFLRAWLAEFLKVRPVLAFIDGEVSAAGKVSMKLDRTLVLVDRVVSALGEGRRVWAGVSHGGAPAEAAGLAEHLRELFDVDALMIAEMAPSIYLHGGPGVLAVFAARRTFEL